MYCMLLLHLNGIKSWSQKINIEKASMLIIIGTMTTSADVQAKLSEIWHSDHM